jgi:hypothetical protein
VSNIQVIMARIGFCRIFHLPHVSDIVLKHAWLFTNFILLIILGFVVAVRSSALLFPPSGVITSGSINGSVVIGGSSLITGSVTVLGTLTINGTLSLSPGATLTVSNNLVISGILNVSSSGVVTVVGSLALGQNAVLYLAPPAPTGVVVTTVASYDSVSGVFSSVVVTPAVCTSPDQTYGGSALTVTVNFACGGGLRFFLKRFCLFSFHVLIASTGAIIGIAVGSVCAGALIIIGIILAVKYSQNREDRNANRSIRHREQMELTKQ